MSSGIEIDAVRSLSSNKFDVFLGKKIRNLREKRGVALEEFARLLRVDEDSLKEYEAGSKKMPATLIVQVSQQLCVSLSDIFSDETSMLNSSSHRAELE